MQDTPELVVTFFDAEADWEMARAIKAHYAEAGFEELHRVTYEKNTVTLIFLTPEPERIFAAIREYAGRGEVPLTSGKHRASGTTEWSVLPLS